MPATLTQHKMPPELTVPDFTIVPRPPTKPVPMPVSDSGRQRYAVMAGTFNPFHVGHLDIALKASALFDRVEIVQCSNDEKPVGRRSIFGLKSLSRFDLYILPENQLLTDYIESAYQGADVSLVRGLRNSLDLQAEINLARFYQDLMPTLKIVYLICDREFEHVSSTAVRALSKYGRAGEYIVT